MTVTTEMTFTSGVTSSNFDTIKDDLKEAIANALGVDSSIIELTLKSSITESYSGVVVATITSTDEYGLAGVEAAIESSSFVSTVNTEISNSATLFSAGVTLDSVTDHTVEGLQGQYEMTFTSGVTSSNFDTLKDELKEAMATALGVDSSMIELTLKNSISRSTSTVVVVTITSKDENVVGDVEGAIESSSFVSTVNTEISSSETLLSAGVTVDSVTVPTVEGLPGE